MESIRHLEVVLAHLFWSSPEMVMVFQVVQSACWHFCRDFMCHWHGRRLVSPGKITQYKQSTLLRSPMQTGKPALSPFSQYSAAMPGFSITMTQVLKLLWLWNDNSILLASLLFLLMICLCRGSGLSPFSPFTLISDWGSCTSAKHL